MACSARRRCRSTKRGDRAAEAAARRPGGPEDRAEPQIRHDRAVARHGIDVAPFDDTMLISYALDCGKTIGGGHGMDELSERLLGHKPIAFKEVTGTRQGAEDLRRGRRSREATRYAAEDADLTLRLWRTYAAARRARTRHALRDHRAPARPRARPHGAARHQGRSRDAVAALRATSRSGPPPSRPRPPTRRADVQPRLARKQLGEILFDKMGLAGRQEDGKTGA